MDDHLGVGILGEVLDRAITDGRMHEGVECRGRFFVPEGRGRQLSSVESPIVGDDVLTEPLGELSQQRLPRCDDLARDLVGVDDGRAMVGEDLGDG